LSQGRKRRLGRQTITLMESFMTATSRGAPLARAAVDLVRLCEGLYLKAYLCPAGVPTIGYGHTRGVRLGQTITAAQADALLAQDLDEAAAAVDRLVKVPITPEQRGSLASFVFNVGADEDADDVAEGLGDSTLLKLLNRGDYEGAAAEFGKWTKATVKGVKQDLPGLVKRRAAEAALFRHGIAVPLKDIGPMPQAVVAPAGEPPSVARALRVTPEFPSHDSFR
jgi:lysozyme